LRGLSPNLICFDLSLLKICRVTSMKTISPVKNEDRDQISYGENQSTVHASRSAIRETAIRNPQSAIPLMIVAGEASGDKHGAKLVSALCDMRPELSFELFGAGGDEMRHAGVETYVDAREVAIMGALEVARSLPKFLRVFRRLRDAVNE